MKFNLKVANLKSDNSVISSYDYTYNEIGNRTRVEDANSDRTTWTYDKTSQLLSEHKAGASPYHTTYTYYPLGNRITKEVASGTTTYTHDDANQMRTAEDINGVTTYTYDANGNQTTVEQPNNDLTTNTWSYENQMLQTELPDNTIFTSIYNSDEMRIAKIDTNDLVTSFIWDDQNYITELDDLDTVQVEYTYEPQQYGNLISQCRETETSFHHYDALGSTTDLTDETEVVTDEWNYQAFGEENTRTGTNPNPYQWVGQVGYYHDEDRETHQIRARDYQSQVGRFLSRDPIGFAGGDVNLQRYVGNGVMYRSDPGGLQELVAPQISGMSFEQYVQRYWRHLQYESINAHLYRSRNNYRFLPDYAGPIPLVENVSDDEYTEAARALVFFQQWIKENKVRPQVAGGNVEELEFMYSQKLFGNSILCSIQPFHHSSNHSD